jgi:hypothetical protein
VTTPDKYPLAEAPTNDVTHPDVVDRLSKDMHALAEVLDRLAAASWAGDEPWKALQHLRSSVNDLFVEAEGHRDDTAKTYRPPS